MIDWRLDRTLLVRLCWLGFGFRMFVAMLTPIPAPDGANYMWMAQQFAAGSWSAALDEVFPPLLSLLTAPLVAIGIDAFRAGQLIGAIAGGLTVWPIAKAVQYIAPERAFAVALLITLSPVAVRLAPEVSSEPTFHLFAAMASLQIIRGRYATAGGWAGLAFWVRPEALAIGVACLTLRGGWRALPPLGAAVAALGGFRAAFGHGFDPIPKLEFNAARQDVGLGSDGVDVMTVLENLASLPIHWLEAFQVLGVVILIGARDAWSRRATRAQFLAVLIGLAVIVAFIARRRFLVTWLPLLAPWAAFGFSRLPERARLPIAIVATLTSVLAGLKLPDGDRYGERVVGEYLAEQLEEGEVVTGDMTRVIWFAGMRPLPPRHYSADELEAMVREAEARFVVLGSKRDNAAPVAAALESDYREIVFPEVQRRWAQQRGILVLQRRD